MPTLLEELRATDTPILERDAKRRSGLAKVQGPLSNEVLAEVAVLSSVMHPAVSVLAKQKLDEFAPGEAKLFAEATKKFPKNEKQMTKMLVGLDEAGCRATKELAFAFSNAHREKLGAAYLNEVGRPVALVKEPNGKKAAKATPAKEDKEQTAALFKAIRAKKLDQAKAALSAGANVNAQKTVGEYPRIRPLHLAVLLNRVDIIDFLLDHEADINATDEDGNTPLHYACGAMRLQADTLAREVFDLLLERGTQVDARSNGNISPLFGAIQRGAVDFADLLIVKGADLKVVTSLGTLMSAACGGSYDECATDSPETRGELLTYLRARGLPLDDPQSFDIEEKTIKPADGFSLLHLAAQSANLTVVKMLLKENVPVNPLFKGKTPLDLAQENGYAKVVEVLRAAGGKPGPGE